MLVSAALDRLEALSFCVVISGSEMTSWKSRIFLPLCIYGMVLLLESLLQFFLFLFTLPGRLVTKLSWQRSFLRSSGGNIKCFGTRMCCTTFCDSCSVKCLRDG